MKRALDPHFFEFGRYSDDDGEEMSRHYSKIDWWIVLGLVGGLYFFLAYPIVEFVTQYPKSPWWMPLPYILALLLILSLSWPLHYTVSPNLLVVRSGLIRWRIPLDTIRSAQPRKTFVKGPALSLDRIEVSYRKGSFNTSLSISPRDKETFLNDLIKYSGCLKKIDGRVVNFIARISSG